MPPALPCWPWRTWRVFRLILDEDLASAGNTLDDAALACPVAGGQLEALPHGGAAPQPALVGRASANDLDEVILAESWRYGSDHLAEGDDAHGTLSRSSATHGAEDYAACHVPPLLPMMTTAFCRNEW